MESKKDNNDENSEKNKIINNDENKINTQNNSIEIIPSSHHKNSTHFNLYKKK